MMDAIWYKLRYTPLRDALRGNFTGRLDFHRLVEASTLPEPAKQLLRDVVRKTRLWRLEQVEVTHELMAHFSDGLAAGRSVEQLIEEFGNERQAATLIRRAKRRNRPWPWQVCRALGFSMGALLVLYFGYAIYFLSGRPSPRINYVATINRDIEKVPVEDRAWPLYRRALINLREIPSSEFRAGLTRKEWPRLTQLVRKHEADIEWIRQGAAKPSFGFLVGAGGSAYDSELFPEVKARPVDPVIGQPLSQSEWPSIRADSNLAALLRADARFGRETKDANRVLRDIHAMLGLSRQIGEKAPLLWALISASIYSDAIDEIKTTLHENPGLLSDKDWMELAHQLSAPKVAADFITFESERMWFDDMLQRSFTDDGMGNGRLTSEGVAFWDLTLGTRRNGDWRGVAFHPFVGLLVPSRQKLEGQYTQLLNRASANIKQPMRNADWQVVQDDLKKARQSFLESINPLSVWAFIPDFSRCHARMERLLGDRDGAVIGISLELYRRNHGRYPDELAALVPQFISEVAVDRITGDPVRYRITERQPTIYSVGGNRKDDGGKPSDPPESAVTWDSSKAVDGDWILYGATK